MTREEIQAVIDKGGFLFWPEFSAENELGGNPLIKPICVRMFRPGDSEYQVNKDSLVLECYDYHLEMLEIWPANHESWREATEEEIKKYTK